MTQKNLDRQPPANLAALPAPPWLPAAILILWTAILAVIAIRLGIHPNHNSVYYPLFYNTGKTWNAGGDVYLHIQDFRYSPIVAAFFGLLSRLPARLAQYLWLILNVSILLWGAARWLQHAAPRPLAKIELCTIALLVTPLMVGNINDLQANPLMLGLMLLALAASFDKSWWLAAAAVAAATALKLYPITLGLILIVYFPKPISWRLLILLAVLAAIPYALQSTAYVNREYYQWLHGLAGEDRSAMGINVMYRDAASLWAFFVGPVYSPYYRIFQILTAALVALTTVWSLLWKASTQSKLAFLWTLLCAWILLAGPSTESDTYILAALPAAWLVIDSFHQPRFTWTRPLSIVAFLFLMIGAGSSWFPIGRPIKSLGFQPISILFLLAAIITWMFTQPAPDHPAADPPPV